MHRPRTLLYSFSQRCIYKLDGMHNVTKIRPMPDSKIQLFWLLFPTLALFLAPNHDFHRSLSLSWRSIPSPITTFLLLRMPRASKMADNRPHFLRSIAIAAVHPVYIIDRWDKMVPRRFCGAAICRKLLKLLKFNVNI